MMPYEQIHRFERDGKRFAVDPETCFCFECDAISWDVLEYYPHTPVNQIYHLLSGKHDRHELAEVVGELEWLRATKSILTIPRREDLLKWFELERGLKRVTVALPREVSEDAAVARRRLPTVQPPTRRRWFGGKAGREPHTARAMALEAIALLLGRSGTQKDIEIEFVEEGAVHHPDLIADLCAHALRTAQLAGKNLVAAIHVANVSLADTPEALRGHTLGIKLEIRDSSEALDHARALARLGTPSLGRLAKAIQPEAPGVTGRIVVRPNHAAFGKAVQELDAAGFNVIELDMDGAYVGNPGIAPAEMLEGMRESAVYYAGRLLERHYFRLDPIASLFWRVYNGTPLRRSDPAGTNELAVDETGGIYPCGRMAGLAEFRLGSVIEGRLDEDRVREFDDVGSLTTPACIRCWARNLCGGGAAAVHHALTGSFRRPHDPWCDAQRDWMGSAIAAFQLLSSKGIHFERVYNVLGRREKPSLFALARAALTLTIGVRPIEEADAELLTKWENWNEAAYFLFNETGLLLATKYDREMDSLHPRGIEHELMLIRKNGEPFGLLKVRPERLAGCAQGWIYMRDEADYASEAIRKGFRAILKEAGGQQDIRRLSVPVSAKEKGLAAFLEAAGFRREGVLREALYLHGGYHEVAVYSVGVDSL